MNTSKKIKMALAYLGISEAELARRCARLRDRRRDSFPRRHNHIIKE